MDFKRALLFCFLLFGLTSAIEVELASDWIPNVGWEVACDWTIPLDDKLQSVKFYQNKQQFMIYRPEKDGPIKTLYFNNSNNNMKIYCRQADGTGYRGKCTLTIEMLKPPHEGIMYTCEVSGERPFFKIERKDLIVEPFLTPSNAVLEVSEQTSDPVRVMLNCTSSALPTPNIVWTVGDQKIPPNFTGSYWNSTSKLFHVWSSLTYTPQSDGLTVTCTPELTSPIGELERGESAKYERNGVNMCSGVNKIIITLGLLCLGLQR